MFWLQIAIRFRHNIPILNVLLYINNNRLPPRGYTVMYIIYNLYLYIICINIYYISLTSAVYSFNCHYNSQLRKRVQYQRDTLHTQQACILLSCYSKCELCMLYIYYYHSSSHAYTLLLLLHVDRRLASASIIITYYINTCF